MPELPEVETTCQGIKAALINQTVTDVIVRHKQLRWPVPVRELKQNLLNQKIIGISRRAKYILIHLPQGFFVIHLGMSGTLRILQKQTASKKHDHFECTLHSGKVLRFNDPRRFGALLWTSSLESLPQFKNLGPEPLDPHFNGATLYQKAQKYRCSVKAFIMNQQVVVGVGNIYANESLYLAGIHPLRAANTIDLKEYKTLHRTIKRVLTQAIKQGGTTLKDFAQADGKPGYFSQRLQVYAKEGEACKKCDTPIVNVKVLGRSTYFCASCQPAIV